MNFNINDLKKRILYRSKYRGTKEMDKLLGNFVSKYIDNLNDLELEKLEKFLHIDDDTLYRFYNNYELKKPIDYNKITELFKKFKLND